MQKRNEKKGRKKEGREKKKVSGGREERRRGAGRKKRKGCLRVSGREPLFFLPCWKLEEGGEEGDPLGCGT
jgi:hypothetical protein